MSLNKVELIGNVGTDPKLKEFDNGGAVCNVSVATTDKGFTTKDGRKIDDKTEWHNVVFRNQLAKIVAKYVHKGDKVFIEGKLATRQYMQDEQTKTITEIIARSFEFMQSANRQQSTTPTTELPQADNQNITANFDELFPF